MTRELPGSLAIALAIHAGVLALVFFTYHAIRPPKVQPVTMTARFLLVEEKAIEATPDPLPPVPEPPKVPPVPEPPVVPPAEIVPPQPAPPVAETHLITTTHHNAPAAPVAVARASRSPAPSVRHAAAAPGGGSAGDTSLAHPRYAVNPPPNYPPDAKRLKQQGEVLLHVKVGADGSAQAVTLKHSSGFPELDEAALAAVRRWKFEPARAAGVPVAVDVDVPVRFRIQ